MQNPSSPKRRAFTNRQLLLLFWGGLCCLPLSCGYRFIGANPLTIACMLPVENLSNEVGAGQVFDAALRSRIGRAGGLGAPTQERTVRAQNCLRARLLQVSQAPLTQATHFRLSAVLELSMDKGEKGDTEDREDFFPIRISESEEFGYGADVLLTEASMRAALIRLADKTTQKAFEHMQMQWP